jgi:class 3 adenylate cyclase
MRFMGDGLLAVFGVPIVREDGAERAVRAGPAGSHLNLKRSSFNVLEARSQISRCRVTRCWNLNEEGSNSRS